MSKVKFNIVNIIVFYIYWYLCLLGPAKNSYYLGPIIALLYFCFHFIYVENKMNDFKLFILCGTLGAIFESVLYYSGFIFYKGILTSHFNIIPLWVLILWLGFGLTLSHSFKWFFSNHIISSVIAGLITPVIYISAHKINSIGLTYSLSYSYIVLAISWIIIFLFINIIIDKYALN